MSDFRVKLPTVKGEALVNDYSIARTVSLTGPRGITRFLRDGDTFTDSNYFKQFCYPQMPLETAFLELVNDDGSTYVDENYKYPVVYDLTVAGGTTFADPANVIDVAGDTGSYATTAQISNLSVGDVRVQINDSAIVTVPGGSAQTFDIGEFAITVLAFDNSASGAADVEVQVFLGVAGGSKT